MAWKKTGVAFATLAPGSMREVNLDGAPVLLVRLAEDVHAIAAICTHEGGILVDGSLEEGRLTCPVHGARFDPRSGSVIADPDGIEPPEGAIEPLARYEVRVAGGMVEVDLGD